MYAVGKLGSYITRGVYTVSGPFHPFGGAVDIIVVEQQDGSFKTSPWYVRFGKFQGVLKTKEKVVNICVNGVDADFHMYLDHKGEAYFLKEVEIKAGETVLYQSSSGEDTDGQSNNRRSIKSKSCNYDDQIDVNNGEVVVRSGSRRGRFMGLVFGRKSIKEVSEETSDTGMIRADSLERAEIAADLLDVNWSTDLATKRSGKDKVSRFSSTDLVDKKVNKALHVNGVQSPVCPTVEDTMETSTSTEVSLVPNEASDASALGDESLEEQGEVVTILSIDKFANLSVIEKDLSSHCLSDETQKDRVQSTAYCETSDSSRLDLNGECNLVIAHAEIAPEKSENLSEVNSPKDKNLENPIDVVNESESLSSVDRHLAASDSVENEVSTSIFNNSVNQVKEEKNVTFENDVGEIEVQQGLNILPSHSEEPQFPFSDIDDLKVGEVKCTDSISPDHSREMDLPSLTLISTEAVSDLSSKNYELHSFLDECVQGNMPRQTSNPINILRLHEFDDAKVDRVAVSLPNMLSNVDTLGTHNLHHPCRSLDLDTKPSKWAVLRENASTCKKLSVDEEQRLAEGQLTIGDNQIPVKLSPADGDLSKASVASSGNWGMWPFSFKRSRTLNVVEPGLNRIMSSSDVENASEGTGDIGIDKTELQSKDNKKKVRLLTPTSEQLVSLNLKDGMNIVTFAFSTPMLGKQQVDARIYLWKWNTRVVISDVDGTITKSDVLGQFMPWVGVDWSQTGVAHLFSAIKENGYQLLFLSARAISQAYLTRQFLCNLKQDGKALPDGPVVISPDGLFPSLFREVIRRAPHEFKIACLEDIKALFPSDISPFYAGFGNRDTDEISYLKVGIPKGKIFIINPKGEIVVNGRIDTKSYPSLHALVHDMFPPMSSTEQEDFNTWNYWKLPPPTAHG